MRKSQCSEIIISRNLKHFGWSVCFVFSCQTLLIFNSLKKYIILFEKVNFILLTKHFSSSCIYIFFFIRSDNILSCHMVKLQHAPQMLKYAPPMEHVVTFHFNSFGGKKK